MTPSEFKQIRKDLDMTQEALGRAMGVSRETIVQIERGYTIKLYYQLAMQQLLWKQRIESVLRTVMGL